MADLKVLTLKVDSGEDLTASEAGKAARLLASSEEPAAAKKAFLVALHGKGESSEEVAAFASTFRELARDPGVGAFSGSAIDIVGTGGDKIGSFNISTASSFVAAAAGVPVMKHGNRSITSKCGSADLIEAVGIPLKPEPEVIRKSLTELKFCFFFAPAYHPAFKEIGPVRKELAAEGQRTIFNILGPLINPGKPVHQVMGVFSPEWVKPLANTLEKLALKRGYVVSCDLGDGRAMDEFSSAGDNRVAGFGEFAKIDDTWQPEYFKFERATLDDLAGGDVSRNVEILEAVAAGQGNPRLVDTICLNAGCALRAAGVATNCTDGVERAREIIETGKLAKWLQKARAFYKAGA